MSAVLKYELIPHGHTVSVMRTMLKSWGSMCEAARNWNGYPTSDTTYRAAFGRGGNGRKLPIPNIPSFATQLSGEVMRLPDDEGNAVTIWYAHNFNRAGQWMELEDRAKLLGIGLKALRYRERAGRELLLLRSPEIVDKWQEWVVARLGQ